jgi:amphi-Trp domain-containing protein
MDKEVDLEFEFDNEELANFLENFAEKLREGQIGLSFEGREEVKIKPTHVNELEMSFDKEADMKELEIEIELKEKLETTEDGREKIKVKTV